MYQNILLEIKDSIAIITLNRPDKLNAYTVAMGEEIVDAFDEIKSRDDVRVVILTGAGRGFCAGVDLDHLKEQFAAAEKGESLKGPKLGEERLIRELPLTLANYPKPVIAALNGHAIGVGVTMTLPCDVRIAADTAKIGLTFARLGILPGLGSTYLLQRVVGSARARELMLTGRVMTAAEAMSAGLLSRVVPADRLMDEALALAREMAECQPAVIAEIRQCLHYAATSTLEQAMLHEQQTAARLRSR